MRTVAILPLLIAALGTTACDAPNTFEPAPEAVTATTATAVEAALQRNAAVGIESAEFVGGFCNVAFFGPSGFSVFIGQSRTVTTASGNTNYSCKADLSIGEGIDALTRLTGISFFDFSFDVGPRIIEPCDVVATPGVTGQASVSCHVTPRGGHVIVL